MKTPTPRIPGFYLIISLLAGMITSRIIEPRLFLAVCLGALGTYILLKKVGQTEQNPRFMQSEDISPLLVSERDSEDSISTKNHAQSLDHRVPTKPQEIRKAYSENEIEALNLGCICLRAAARPLKAAGLDQAQVADLLNDAFKEKISNLGVLLGLLNELTDPITHGLIESPVILPSGDTVDFNTAAQRYANIPSSQDLVCPFSNRAMPALKDLPKNTTLEHLIRALQAEGIWSVVQRVHKPLTQGEHAMNPKTVSNANTVGAQQMGLFPAQSGNTEAEVIPSRLAAGGG